MSVKFLEWCEVYYLGTAIVSRSLVVSCVVVSWMVGGWMNDQTNVKHWLRDDWRENWSTSEFLYLQIQCNLCPQKEDYLLTPWCRFLLEKLTGLQLVKKFPGFHGTWKFITALTSVRHLSPSWATPIQSIYPHPTSWRSTHLRLGLHGGLLPSSFPTKTLYTPLSSPICATCPAHLILLDFITHTILGEQYKSFSSSLRSLLHSPVTSSIQGQNILLNTMFSNTLSFLSFLNVSDQLSLTLREERNNYTGPGLSETTVNFYLHPKRQSVRGDSGTFTSICKENWEDGQTDRDTRVIRRQACVKHVLLF